MQGKYHCAADLQFDWFGFDQTSKTVLIHYMQSSFIQTKKQEVSCAVVMLPLSSLVPLHCDTNGCSEAVTAVAEDQCDQIWRFFALWATL